MKTGVAIAVAMAFPWANATAADDGNALLEKCEAALGTAGKDPDLISSTEALDTGYCLGLVQGVVSAHMLYQLGGGYIDTPLACIPQSITNNQAARIVVEYLEENPERLHLSGAELTNRAVIDAFGCS